MCGRYALAVKPEDVEAEFSMIRIEWFPPRYNIAPTQPILVIRAGREGREAALVRWGLVPSWTKDMAALPLFFNARSETAATKPAFRGAFRHRRCLIPASGFYEWLKAPAVGRSGKATVIRKPYYLAPKRKLVAFAGLWDEWADANGNLLDSATILTTAANDDVAALHDRMPVVVEPQDYDRWLGLGGADEAGLGDILRPAPPGTFSAVPVDPRVNTARFDDPALIVPTGPAEPAAPTSETQLKLL
ncbi:putative SOS response-associated peptidase YedK [Kaistia hirudinis]|uniref:Abasic site processing protein n=1 Tax=Kaistia hirudinis TaxID=1293440 RepID=A0A840AMX4_9HYPH|nr:SOS response-associated peptidase [Kaistia hirudinis]MBB3930623.1 putative SOS response-associated peptidase YedK [Kaistia hirudinis]